MRLVLVTDPGANAAGLVVTNVLEVVIGIW